MIQLDTIDLYILRQLKDDGRKSLTDMANELDVSVGTVRNRLARLQEQGTVRIIGFLDLNHVGIHAYATVYVRVSPSRLIGQVVAELSTYPEVSFLAAVAGDYDLHVDIQCLNNEHLLAVLQQKIQQIEGVINTKTTTVLQVHKYGQPNLEALQISAEKLSRSDPYP